MKRQQQQQHWEAGQQVVQGVQGEVPVGRVVVLAAPVLLLQAAATGVCLWMMCRLRWVLLMWRRCYWMTT
jgi:hypothetical protein